MISCIIVDDEQAAINVLVHYVKQTPHLNLIGSFTNPIEALKVVGEQKIDLVFLDIEMPELSGIDFIKTMNKKSKVILTTAYERFALEGYELSVVDYLLKPIALPRFLAAVQKAIEQVKGNQPAQGTTTEEDYIFVKTESKGKLLKINLEDIEFIESMKNYIAIYRGGQKTLVFTSLKELEERLPKKQFVRVHKSFIIPITRITGIEGNLVRLKNVDSEIPIGENYKTELMDIIRGKMIQ